MAVIALLNQPLINTRVLGSQLSGVQRYTLEIVARLEGRIRCVAPAHKLHGLKGHLWEQVVLPARAGRRLLLSPSNTGPLAVQHQVVVIHDLAALEHPEWLTPQFAAWYQWLLPRLARRVRRIITVSKFTKERLVDFASIPPDKIAVIPNGVDTRFYPRGSDEVAAIRASLRIPTPYYILSLGSLEPRKNLRNLLHAWRIVQGRFPDNLWLVIAGGRGKVSIFKDPELSDYPPRVFFTGHVADQALPALYSGAIAFVYPSIYEGFGLPVVEAMASGTPVLTGNRTALPEVVGDAGLLVDCLDVDSIAYGLMKLVDDSTVRQSLAERGRDRAKNYTWERTAESVWQILADAQAE